MPGELDQIMESLNPSMSVGAEGPNETGTAMLDALQQAKSLGLDLNTLDFDALDSSIQTGQDFGTTSGVLDAAVENAPDLVDTYGDNAYLVYGVPKTGNKELDMQRLDNAMKAEGTLLPQQPGILGAPE
jgi:hypothetical protein